uniref:NmrA-like family domain-containing protein 1 n=1 Tax=Bos indicus x Bos taurus TaxID=30522 RepID=A0A4W2ESI4_BOBOX
MASAKLPLRTLSSGQLCGRAMLEGKKYVVRALTRDVTQPKAQVLWDLGAEVVKGDLNDKASVEAALKGAYGAFLVTNSWDHFSKEKEVCQASTFVPQGKVVADVAKSQGLKHVVYSGLENVKRLTNGKLEVLHFDGKGEVEEYFWSIGVPMTTIFIFLFFKLALPMGDVPMDGISVADIGAVVCSIFNSPEEFVGKAVGLSAEALTIQQYADVLSKGLGKEITPEAYQKLEFPGAKEMANMCRFYQMKPDRDIQLTHRLNPKVKSFSQFISENQAALKSS